MGDFPHVFSLLLSLSLVPMPIDTLRLSAYAHRHPENRELSPERNRELIPENLTCTSSYLEGKD
jgi:hypothetical protein